MPACMGQEQSTHPREAELVHRPGHERSMSNNTLSLLKARTRRMGQLAETRCESRSSALARHGRRPTNRLRKEPKTTQLLAALAKLRDHIGERPQHLQTECFTSDTVANGMRLRLGRRPTDRAQWGPKEPITAVLLLRPSLARRTSKHTASDIGSRNDSQAIHVWHLLPAPVDP